MENDVIKPKTLEDRIKDKLYESMGDLIQPEDVKIIVEHGIEEFLFKPRVKKQRGGWNSSDIDVEVSLVQELIDKHLKQQVIIQVERWLKDNPEKLEQALQKAITQGVGLSVLSTLDQRFESLFASAMMNLKSQGLFRELMIL